MNPRRLAVVSFCSLVLVLPATADVTTKTLTRSSGHLGMGGGESATTRVVKGVTAREDSDFKFSGKMMKLVAGEKSGTQIIRVDLDKIWRLNTKRKTYTETAISAAMKPVKESAPSSQPEAGAPAPDEKPTHRIKKTDVSVKKTGAKKTINSFATEETEARMQIDIEEIATADVTSYVMVTRFWMTPMSAELKKALDEEVKFQKSYMAKMGVTFSPQDRAMFGGVGLAMMLGVGDNKIAELITQLKDKTKQLSGYPIVTESEWFVNEDPKAVARRRDAKAAEAEESPELSADPQTMAGNLLGSFAKKKMKQRQDAKEKAQEGKPAYSAYHEVVSLTTTAADPSLFEIPAGFKLVR